MRVGGVMPVGGVMRVKLVDGGGMESEFLVAPRAGKI